MNDSSDSRADQVSLILVRLYSDSGRLGAHWAELRGILWRLEELGRELESVEVATAVGELEKWEKRARELWEGLLNTIQLACWLVEL